MKEKRALILAAVIGACAMGFAACGEKEIPHEHVWLPWEEILPPSCTLVGREIRYCAGDETCFEEREIPATGHDFEWFVLENGHEGFCGNCGIETGAQAHTYENGACEFCGAKEY